MNIRVVLVRINGAIERDSIIDGNLSAVIDHAREKGGPGRLVCTTNDREGADYEWISDTKADDEAGY